jgi:hypothetical protein
MINSLVAGFDCLTAANPQLSVNHNKPLPIGNCMYLLWSRYYHDSEGHCFFIYLTVFTLAFFGLDMTIL